MSSPRCLIFNNYPLRVTDGGPSGFLAQNLVGFDASSYRLGECHAWHEPAGWRGSWRSRISREPQRTLQRIGLSRSSRYASWLYTARHTFVREAADRYPWIWFHDVMTMTACLDLLAARQNVILQPHCPQLPSEEEASLGASEEDRAWVESAQRRAFTRANVCVLPNEHVTPIYASLLSPGCRVEYLASGCRQATPRYVLPLDPQYVYYVYLGRRVPIKGFDIVCEAFRRAHRINSSLRLLVIGSGGPLDQSGTIDIGFSDQAVSYLASCDYLVSANRQSYFDLSVMEALSLGLPLLIACTGGHKFFCEHSGPGITAVPEPTVERFTEAILANCRKRSSNSPACDSNRGLYREYFADSAYRLRLDGLLNRLVNGE